MSKIKWDFRDVSAGFQILREFLLGRKHNLHGRFPPKLASRTIPTPDIPRGPEYKYSEQYYFTRSGHECVKPPVVAPVAEGPPLDHKPTTKAVPGGIKPDSINFNSGPTPGMAWWWDGHCYYECLPKTNMPPPRPPPPPAHKTCVVPPPASGGKPVNDSKCMKK